MGISNKSLALKRLRELKKIFEKCPNVTVRRFYNYKEVPFGLAVEIEGESPLLESADVLANNGFDITRIATIPNKKEDGTQSITLKLELTKFEVEKEFGFDGPDYTLEDWEGSEYMRTAKEICSENYWQVRYTIRQKDYREYLDKAVERSKEIEKLKADIDVLKGEKTELQSKLLTALLNEKKEVNK